MTANQPIPDIIHEIRPSPNYIAIAFVSVAVLFSLLVEQWIEDDRLVYAELYTVLVIVSAVGIWLSRMWREEIGRWFTVFAPILLISIGAYWLDAPELLIWLVPIIALAAVFIDLKAATGVTVTNTLLLLGIAYYGPWDVYHGAVLALIGSLWMLLGLMMFVYLPIYDRLQWTAVLETSAHEIVDETREQRAEMESTVDAIAHVNRELGLQSKRMEAMRREAEEAKRAKADFVATISHEFRTPLNMIIGMIDTISETPEFYEQEIPPVLLEDLEIVHRNSLHLASMINDILDLSQAESGQLNLWHERADIALDIKYAADVIRPMIDAKGLTLWLDISDDIPQFYYDRTRIRQVILNLVSNATRFTDDGGITIRASSRNNHVIVEVEDTGSGISKEDTPRVFEPFFQISGGSHMAHDGSGLGLSICRQLVEHHGGRLSLESEVGKGTTVSFYLPKQPRTSGTETPERWISEDWVFGERSRWPVIPRLPNRQRVVLYDETGEFQTLANQHTDEFELIDTVTIEQAVQEVRNCPALAVVVNMTSSYDVQTTLEDMRSRIDNIPLIGCSFRRHTEKHVTEGALVYLVKPVRRLELLKAINAIDNPIRSILIVDDDIEMLRLLSRMLTSYDEKLQISTASSGLSGLDEMRRRLPDLVLLDIVLPDIDGWQVLQEKASDATVRDIPTIIVSGEDIVTKPTRTGMLLTTVDDGLSMNDVLVYTMQFSKLILDVNPESDQAPG